MLSKLDEHLSKSWRSRRYIFMAVVATALFLCVYCTVAQVPLVGEALLTTLLTITTVTYTGGKVIEKIRDRQH